MICRKLSKNTSFILRKILIGIDNITKQMYQKSFEILKLSVTHAETLRETRLDLLTFTKTFMLTVFFHRLI